MSYVRDAAADPAADDAELYPQASRSSAEFAKYKAITLGQCLPREDETPESPGLEI